jgi:hypothetical protein
MLGCTDICSLLIIENTTVISYQQSNQIKTNWMQQITACGMVSSCGVLLALRRAAAAALLTANPPLQQHTIPHAVICSLTLLMMGKRLSETC